MAEKGYTECPECGVEVNAKKLKRHMRKVHPEKAEKHGIPRRSKGRKAKTLSAKKLELLEERKSKERMMQTLKVTVVIVIIVALILLAYFWTSIFPPEGNPVAVVETSKGTIKFELYEDKVPDTVENFEKYVKAGFYEGLIFHRVANLDSSRPDTHVIQTGGFEPGMERKEPIYPPIDLEIDNSLTHEDGAVAMARQNDPDTASSQFYICDGSHHFLDDKERQAGGQGRGYAVFGKVTHGMDVVRVIGGVTVHTEDGYENVPVEDVVINKVYME